MSFLVIVNSIQVFILVFQKYPSGLEEGVLQYFTKSAHTALGTSEKNFADLWCDFYSSVFAHPVL